MSNKPSYTNNAEKYDSRVHMVGRTTLILGFILTFLPPIILWLYYGILPPAKSLLNGIFSISSIMLPVSIVEVLTFTPILGASAMYMAYLTGNLSNMKIPSAAISMEVAEVKPSTPEGDIVSTIAIAGSVIASEVIIALGVILIAPLSSKLNSPVIQPAFQQILPALFGSIGAYYILKEWKLAVMPLICGIVFSFIGGLPTAITIPLCVLASILSARFLYKKNLIKTE